MAAAEDHQIDLHDATLESIEVDWGRATVVVRLAALGGPIVLTATGLRSIVVPRYEPWGPSSSVNKAGTRTHVGELTLELQMQSGDEIVIRAASLTV